MKLCKGLTAAEAACRCVSHGCRATIYTEELIAAYAKFRKLVGVPLRINRLYSCAYHNYVVGGTEMSQHLIGNGCDINAKSLVHLSQEEIEFACKKAGFTYIIFGDGYIHMDCR